MFTFIPAVLKQLKNDEKGVTALEYGVIAAAIVVGLTLVLPALATALEGTFTTITGAL